MNAHSRLLGIGAILGACAIEGCASATRRDDLAATVGAVSPVTREIDWDEIDQTVDRVREREKAKPHLVETSLTVETGYVGMTDTEYAVALDEARAAIKDANPKMSADDLEREATKRADEAKVRHEHAFTKRASSTLEWKRR